MNEADFYTQAHSVINGRNVWHYLVVTPIGHIHIVQYEQKGLEIKRFIIDESNQKAEKKYDQICMQMVKGRI